MDTLGDPLTTCLIRMGCQLTKEPYPSWWFRFIDEPDRQFGHCSVSTNDVDLMWQSVSFVNITSQYSSNLALLQPQNETPNTLDRSSQTQISKLAYLRPPSVSSHSLGYGLQVCKMMAYKCISKYARVLLPSASPNSLNHGLQVYFQTRSIMA